MQKSDRAPDLYKLTDDDIAKELPLKLITGAEQPVWESLIQKIIKIIGEEI